MDNLACENQVVNECLPVSVFGDITMPNLKVVTVGLNPALNEFIFAGVPKERSQRLAMLGDYGVMARTGLCDANVADANTRREKYFRDSERDWHSYFEKMENVLNQVNPAWTYGMGSAVHIDLVACATRDRWGKLTSGCQTAMIANCREHVLAALSKVPNGTVILCDGPRATQEIQNLGLRVEQKPKELINVRPASGGDLGWLGDIFVGEKKFPFRGWSSQVSRLPAVWRCDLALWIHATLFPMSTWVGIQALQKGDDTGGAADKTKPVTKHDLSRKVSDRVSLGKAEKPRNACPLRIVMVNDESPVLMIFDTIIRRWFSDITTLLFTNSAAALVELSRRDPDLLITDDIMPGMSGQELCQRLFERQVKYPIIVDSSWNSTEQWVRDMANRGLNVSFMAIPCNIEVILAAVETALKIKRLPVENPRIRRSQI